MSRDATGPSTRSVHAGRARDPESGAIATPIHLSSTYFSRSTQDLVDYLEGRKPANFYARYANPTVDADTVLTVVTREWLSAATRNQEKLLRYGVRMKYWSENLPPDMRLVYHALGYPTGRVLLTPIGHTEEWWYYGVMAPPLRFRDGELLDTDRFEDMLSR